MNPFTETSLRLTRRQLLGRTGLGLGALALESLLSPTLPGGEARGAAAAAGAQPLPIRAPQARRIVYLFQNGGPSHVDLFDYKPQLRALQGEEIPDQLTAGKRFSTMTSTAKKTFLPAITRFAQVGQCGKWLAADFLPQTASIVDDLCFVQSMQTTQVNHAPAITHFLTGSERPGKPSIGAWLTYGLGSDADNLPAYVVMTSRDREASCGQIFYDFYWGSGFLPSEYQGVNFRGAGEPVLYLANPPGLSRAVRRGQLDDLAALNAIQRLQVGDPEIDARVAQYEMAYRMQASVPELADLSNEPAHVLAMYGPHVTTKGSYAYNCLMARRLAERGCRFIQVMHAGWDQHSNLKTQLRIQCADTDAPSAALVADLKQRGLLDDTLVIWGGEFGRTPFLQTKPGEERWGRDHHPYAFSLWMGGGGTRAGTTYGASDEFGFTVARDPVNVRDFQATILHLMGIDHERFTFRYQGLDQRLTGVEPARVVAELLA